MLIDWFTVGAQVLNFLILVWLLKRFLYKPVLAAVDGREQRIQLATKAAAAKQLEAQAQLDDFTGRNKTFDEQRAAKVAEVIEQTSSQREHLLDEARKEADELRAQSASSIRNDRARMESEMARLAGDEVFNIARKVLTDLASVDLEERMAAQFVRRLRALDSEAKKLLATAVAHSSEPVLLRSGFDLPARDRATIQKALNETLAADVLVRFDTAPDAICGIELRANGQSLAWNISDYLDALRQKACALSDAQIAPSAAMLVPAPSPIPVPTSGPVPLPVPAASAATQ